MTRLTRLKLQIKYFFTEDIPFFLLHLFNFLKGFIVKVYIILKVKLGK